MSIYRINSNIFYTKRNPSAIFYSATHINIRLHRAIYGKKKNRHSVCILYMLYSVTHTGTHRHTRCMDGPERVQQTPSNLSLGNFEEKGERIVFSLIKFTVFRSAVKIIETPNTRQCIMYVCMCKVWYGVDINIYIYRSEWTVFLVHAPPNIDGV